MKKFRSPAVIIRSLHMHEFRRNHRIPEEVNHCLNCGNDYLGNFCPACGQSRKVRKVSFSNMVHNIPQMIGSADHNIFYTYLELMFRPGHAMRDYIRGHRVRYSQPISLVLVLMLIYVLLTFILGTSELKPLFSIPFDFKGAILGILPSEMQAKLLSFLNESFLSSGIESLCKWYDGNVAVHFVVQIPIYAVATIMAYKHTQNKSAQTVVREKEDRLGEEDPDEGFEPQSESSIFEALVIIPLSPILNPLGRIIASSWRLLKKRIRRFFGNVAGRFAIRPDAVIDLAHRTGETYDNLEDSIKTTLRHHSAPRGKIGIPTYNFLEMVFMRSFMSVVFISVNIVAIFLGYRLGSMNVLFILLTFLSYKQFYSQNWLFSIGKTIQMYFYFVMMIAVLSGLIVVVGSVMTI